MSETTTEAKPLQVATPESVRRELSLKPPAANLAEVQPGDDLEKRADNFVEQLIAYPPAQKEETKDSVENMAAESQKKAARISQMLTEPIRAISKRGSENGEVGNALIQLKMKVEELDPAKFDLQPGWFSRMAGHLPGVGDPIKRYFTKYESAQTVIQAIVGSLEKGRDQLLRDNQTLNDDQKEMWDATERLQKSITLAQLIDRKLSEKLTTITDPEKKKFVEEELLFSLRQRTIDLQQQLAVSQQGVIAMELIVRNNKELVRGVNRAMNVTISALQVGVTVALALEKQKEALDKVNAVSKTTSDLIAGTAARLKTQGAEIQKQASSATLNMDSLRAAFADLNSALEDISKFRSNALPQMANTVIELDQMTAGAAKTLARIDQSKRHSKSLQIDVE